MALHLTASFYLLTAAVPVVPSVFSVAPLTLSALSPPSSFVSSDQAGSAQHSHVNCQFHPVHTAPVPFLCLSSPVLVSAASILRRAWQGAVLFPGCFRTFECIDSLHVLCLA